MYCHRCGNGLPNDAVFCNICGTRVLLTDQDMPGPSPLGKVTVQFGDSSPMTPPRLSGSLPYPPTQFGDNSPITPPQFSGLQYPPTQFGDSSPQLSSSQQYPQYPASWPISSVPLPQQAVSPSTQSQQPMTPVQQFLVRVFGSNLASNALFGVVLGGIFAAVGGIVITAILVSIAHAIAPHIINASIYSSSEDIIDFALGIVPLHNLFRDSLQLFLVMHGVGIHTQYGSDSFSYLGPLHGLLIVPALLLTLAGYLAASTDFQNRVQSSLWRGVAIALPYTGILFLVLSQVNGCIPAYGQANADLVCSGISSSPSSAGVLSMDNLTLLVFGLFWGCFFGLLGASLKLARGQWRHMLRQYLRMSSRPQFMGMLVGGLAASGLGISLALVVLFSFIAYASYSVPLLVQDACLPSGDWQAVIIWSIAQGPLHAVNLFFLSFGAPINISNPQQYSCFYTRSAHASISMFGSDPQLSPWTHLLLALPVISLFLGGRVSAAIGRAHGIGSGAIQGALIAVPFTVLMVLLTIISTITNTSSSSAVSAPANSYVQSAGPGVFELLLWALLCGAVVGALGGMYQTGMLKTGVSQFLSALALPLVLLSKPGYTLLDRLTGQPRTSQRSPVRSLLYAAFLCTLLLVIAAGVAGAILIVLNQALSLTDNLRIRDILSVVLIALPGLLLLSVCASALSRDPQIESQSNTFVPAMQ
ncbi:MAG: zinc ribbon domain-containing protein [Ktedonobacteraceae bacterium]